MTLKPENFISPEKAIDEKEEIKRPESSDARYQGQVIHKGDLKFEPVKLPIRATVRNTSMGTQGKAIESFLFRQISILIKMSCVC